MLARGRRICAIKKTLHNNIDLWSKNADANEDDDDTRLNVNIGRWPDDVRKDKTFRPIMLACGRKLMMMVMMMMMMFFLISSTVCVLSFEQGGQNASRPK